MCKRLTMHDQSSNCIRGLCYKLDLECFVSNLICFPLPAVGRSGRVDIIMESAEGAASKRSKRKLHVFDQRLTLLSSLPRAFKHSKLRSCSSNQAKQHSR